MAKLKGTHKKHWRKARERMAARHRLPAMWGVISRALAASVRTYWNLMWSSVVDLKEEGMAKLGLRGEAADG